MVESRLVSSRPCRRTDVFENNTTFDAIWSMSKIIAHCQPGKHDLTHPRFLNVRNNFGRRPKQPSEPASRESLGEFFLDASLVFWSQRELIHRYSFCGWRLVVSVRRGAGSWLFDFLSWKWFRLALKTIGHVTSYILCRFNGWQDNKIKFSGIFRDTVRLGNVEDHNWYSCRNLNKIFLAYVLKNLPLMSDISWDENCLK